MTHPEQPLSHETIWDDAGHLSELAVSVLVDGELALVPGAAPHAELCPQCAGRVGSAALLALEIATVLEPGVPAPASGFFGVPRRGPGLASPRRPFPVAALGSALCVAFVAILPGLHALLPGLLKLEVLHERGLPLLAQLLARLLVGATRIGEAFDLGWPAGALLLVFGALVARLAPQPRASQGAS